MPAHLRYQPEPWMTHMVTTRCLEGQPLMIPTEHTNKIITGCFAYSLRRFKDRVTLNNIATLSNHYHAIISAESQPTLSAFMSHLNGCLGKELGVINDAHGHIWHRRYASHLLLDEQALIDAYKYIFANSVKEGLVEHPRDWPGLHGYAALCEGETLEGVWINRTAWSAAQRRALAKRLPPPNLLDFSEPLTLTLTPPPIWSYRPHHLLQADCARWAEEVVTAHAQERRRRGGRVLGRAGVLEQPARQRRALTHKTPRPLCRAGCPRRFAQHHQDYRQFAAHYRDASARLRRGLAQHHQSPRVCFPPGGVPLCGGG